MCYLSAFTLAMPGTMQDRKDSKWNQMLLQVPSPARLMEFLQLLQWIKYGLHILSHCRHVHFNDILQDILHNALEVLRGNQQWWSFTIPLRRYVPSRADHAPVRETLRETGQKTSLRLLLSLQVSHPFLVHFHRAKRLHDGLTEMEWFPQSGQILLVAVVHRLDPRKRDALWPRQVAEAAEEVGTQREPTRKQDILPSARVRAYFVRPYMHGFM